MKRVLSAVMCVVFLFLVSACASPSADGGIKTSSSAAVQSTPTVDPIVPYDLVLTEVMASNTDLCLGHDLDWVEIHNREEFTVSLEGYFLTDDADKPNKLSLAEYRIAPDGYLVIVLPDDAPFRLSASGETVLLTLASVTVSSLSFPAGNGGESYGTEGLCAHPTPGFANTEEGFAAYTASLPVPPLQITEVLPSNDAFLPVSGEYYDLVEVRNVSSEPLALLGYTLTDKRTELSRYSFPDVTLAPGEHFVVYCSSRPDLGSLHASFKVSSAGETLFLAKDGTVCDLLTVPGDLKKNESYGRFDMLPRYYPIPTPGAENGEGFPSGVALPEASLPSGLYPSPVTVTLTGEGTIHYTLDGSRPTVSSPVYTGPISVGATMTVRAFCTSEGRVGSLTAYTYVIGAEHELPVVSVALPQHLLIGETGILNNVSVTYEYEGIVTMIEGGEEKFSVPVGFRLHGNGSRAMPKQNFQLRFRSEYGAGKLKYPLFENRSFDEYHSLLLKGGSEDWDRAVMRDELCTAIVDGTTALSAQAIKPVVLYLGGEYWGVYYLRERFSDEYVASHFDVSPESVDLLHSTGAYVQAGSATEYRVIRNYIDTHDMSLPENYAWLCERIDALSLIDWYVCRSFMGDKDTGNVRRFRSSEGDGKWRWMYFDLDWSFYHTTDRPLSSIAYSGGDCRMFRALVSSEQGRDAFLRRYAELLSGPLSETAVIAVIDSLAAAVESEMERDRARWSKDLNGWYSAVERLRKYVRGGVRATRAIEDLREYFNLTDEEMKQYFKPWLQTP